MGVFGEWARKYAESGLSIVPVNGKVPVIKEWQGLSIRSNLESELTEWEIKFGASNKHGIGCVLGEASGIICLDIDTDDGRIHGLFPHSPCVRKGKKGAAYFFKWRSGLINKTIKGVGDFLVTGRQVVLPPSSHPDTGLPYIWVGGHELGRDEIDNLPDWPLSMQGIEELEKKAMAFAGTKSGGNWVGGSSGSVAGRNNALKDQVCAALFAGDKSLEEIAEEIFEYDLNNHTPPLFNDGTEPHMGKGRESAIKFVQRVSKSIPKASAASGSSVVNVSYELKKVADKLEKNKVPVLTQEDGLLYDFMALFNQVTTQKIEGIGLGYGIGLVSALIGNRVRLGNMAPNVYCLSIAAAGIGKTTGMDLVKYLVGDLNILGAGTYRSKKAVLDGFLLTGNGSRVRLDTIDEAGSLFRHVNSKSKNEFSIEMSPAFCSLFTASNGRLDGIKQAKKENSMDAVKNPYCSIISATTPSGMGGGFNKEMIEQGLIPRFLIFKDNIPKEEYNVECSEIKSFDDLHGLSKVRDRINCLYSLPWEQEKSPPGVQILNPGELKMIVPSLNWSQEALAYRNNLVKNKINIPKRDATYRAGMDWKVDGLNRSGEHIIKLATIHWASRYAAGLGDGSWIVGIENIKWAEKIWEWCFDNFEEVFGALSDEDGIDPVFLNRVKKARSFIGELEDNKEFGRKDISVKCFHKNLSANVLTEILKNLEDSAIIRKSENGWKKI